MLTGIHYLTGQFLLWLIDQTSYHIGLLFKDTIGNVLSCIVGFIIAILFVLFIVKDSRLSIDDKTEHIYITQIMKNKRMKIFVTMPPDKGNKLTVFMGVALFFNVALIKFFPIKQIQFVGRYKMYICFWITLILILLFFIFSLSINYHLILPDGHGGYYVEY